MRELEYLASGCVGRKCSHAGSGPVLAVAERGVLWRRADAVAVASQFFCIARKQQSRRGSPAPNDLQELPHVMPDVDQRLVDAARIVRSDITVAPEVPVGDLQHSVD